jgi:hypothetical protein
MGRNGEWSTTKSIVDGLRSSIRQIFSRAARMAMPMAVKTCHPEEIPQLRRRLAHKASCYRV